jgi:hypothetical protein
VGPARLDRLVRGPERLNANIDVPFAPDAQTFLAGGFVATESYLGSAMADGIERPHDLLELGMKVVAN